MLARGGSFAPGSCQDAASDGRPGDASDAGGAAVGDHFPFFFSVEEVVVVLHGDELVPALLVRRNADTGDE